MTIEAIRKVITALDSGDYDLQYRDDREVAMENIIKNNNEEIERRGGLSKNDTKAIRIAREISGDTFMAIRALQAYIDNYSG